MATGSENPAPRASGPGGAPYHPRVPRETTATPAEAAPAGTTLIVETTPPGVLTIDGQRVGSTPYQGALSPGAHVVRVESPGHQSWRSRIELAAGQSRHLSVSLEPVAASTELAHVAADER